MFKMKHCCNRCNEQIEFLHIMAINASICQSCMDIYSERKSDYFNTHPSHTFTEFYQEYRQRYTERRDQVYFMPYTTALRVIRKKMDMVTQIVQTHAPYLRWDSGPGIILAETIWGTLDAHGFEQPGQRVVQQKYSRPYVSKPRHTKQQIFEVWDIHDKYDLICNEYANKLPRIIGKPGCAASIREDFGETYLSLFTV